MAVDKREVQSKWQVYAADLGGSNLLGEFDTQSDATDLAVNHKAANPASWVYVSQNTFIIVDEA